VSGSSEVPSTSDPKATDWDRALPFQLDALGVRGRLVRLGPALDAIIERHGYPLAVARPLAEAMTLCAALATSLKYDGIFTLQISGDGPIRLLVTDLTSDGALRGYAQFDSWKLAVALGGLSEAPEGYVPRLFGHGRLAFTVDQGQHTQRYQGVVPLEGATLTDCAHTYFRQSEQLPTGIKIAAKREERDGTGHWWAQRVSAVALIPLTLWFMFSLLALPALDYATVRAWLSFPLSGFLAVLLVGVLTYHSHLGTMEVIEDYVHSAGMKVLSLLLLRFVHVLVGGASIFAIMRIAFGP